MSNKKPDANYKNKSDIFTPYLSDAEVNRGLENGFIKGGLRVNRRNNREAYVTHPKLDSDVLVYDKDINRALYDDIVAVKIHMKNEWKVLDEVIGSDADLSRLMQQMSIETNPGTSRDEEKNAEKNAEKILEKNVKKNMEKISDKNAPFTIRMLLQQFPNFFTEKYGWDSSAFDLNDSCDFPTECTDWWRYFQRTGAVVSVIHRMNSRFCVGTLNLPENMKKPFFTKFFQTDYRYPILVVAFADCPRHFLNHPNEYKDVKFIGRIGEWDVKHNYPKGYIHQCLKDMTLIEQETTKILAQSGFEDTEFTDEILNSIPIKVSATTEDYLYRRDVRSECVFSIDLKTTQDLDDALHIKELPSHSDGGRLWEVGVHIADVSQYVLSGSQLDVEAAKRSTTVYMVHRAVTMLPRGLCDHLCSLHPGEDKLSYSVIYKITDAAEIVDVWIGRTMMNSACKLSYEEAQTVIDNATKSDWTTEDFDQIYGKFTASDIAQSILNLNHLTVQIRQRRFNNGSLWINQPKIGFILNDERNVPLGYKTYKLSASNDLIEEWMLQANITIAEFIHKHLRKTAFLRKQRSPSIKAIMNINKQFDYIGWKDLHIQTGSTEELLKLINMFKKGEKDYVIMMYICRKAMEAARYFSHNDDDNKYEEGCSHFGIGVPLYTNFTSPIRRYPDVIVHRQITEVLMQHEKRRLDQGDHSAKGKLKWLVRLCTRQDVTSSRLSYLGDYCNKKKKDAKAADKASNLLFYTLFVQKSGSYTESAIVMRLLDKAFDVLLTHVGFVKRVYMDQLDVEPSSFIQTDNILTIGWRQSPKCLQQQHSPVCTTLTLLSEIRITMLAIDEGPNSAPKLKLELPNPGCSICGITLTDGDSDQSSRDIANFQSDIDNGFYNNLDNI